jgi:S-phase kinase-associated protein 1
MDIRLLLEVTCIAVAKIIDGKSPTELREIFAIENDYTPEEEEQVRKELAWCEEK